MQSVYSSGQKSWFLLGWFCIGRGRHRAIKHRKYIVGEGQQKQSIRSLTYGHNESDTEASYATKVIVSETISHNSLSMLILVSAA